MRGKPLFHLKDCWVNPVRYQWEQEGRRFHGKESLQFVMGGNRKRSWQAGHDVNGPVHKTRPLFPLSHCDFGKDKNINFFRAQKRFPVLVYGGRRELVCRWAVVVYWQYANERIEFTCWNGFCDWVTDRIVTNERIVHSAKGSYSWNEGSTHSVNACPSGASTGSDFL